MQQQPNCEALHQDKSPDIIKDTKGEVSIKVPKWFNLTLDQEFAILTQIRTRSGLMKIMIDCQIENNLEVNEVFEFLDNNHCMVEIRKEMFSIYILNLLL